MIDNTKEYILCSAIRKINKYDGKVLYHEQYSDIYNIELGWRHGDILHRCKGIVSRKAKDQGFYTSKGRFVEREEALKIASECGQVSKEKAERNSILFSEDLY